jgi:hypothetical protein
MAIEHAYEIYGSYLEYLRPDVQPDANGKKVKIAQDVQRVQ